MKAIFAVAGIGKMFVLTVHTRGLRFICEIGLFSILSIVFARKSRETYKFFVVAPLLLDFLGLFSMRSIFCRFQNAPWTPQENEDRERRRAFGEEDYVQPVWH